MARLRGRLRLATVPPHAYERAISYFPPPPSTPPAEHRHVPLLAALLVFLNAFFVAAEFAIVKVRSTRVQELVRKAPAVRRRCRAPIQNLDAYLSATQLGITLASLGLGGSASRLSRAWSPRFLASFGIWSESVVHSISLTLAFATITFLHIVLGELAPKILAIRRPEETSLLVAPPLRLFYRLFYPALWFLNASSNLFLRLISVAPASETELAHSEEELRILLAESHRTGTLSASKRKLLENVFDYTRRSAKHIMVPRADIVYLSLLRVHSRRISRRSARRSTPATRSARRHRPRRRHDPRQGSLPTGRRPAGRCRSHRSSNATSCSCPRIGRWRCCSAIFSSVGFTWRSWSTSTAARRDS